MTPTADVSRRHFLQFAAAGTAGLALAPTASAAVSPSPTATADAVIWINLVGGPSQLDTFDPKPAAPSTVRGPFRPIPTRVPGIQLSELFPKMAAVSDKFSLIRSMHHTAAAVHETGFQLLQTGKLFGSGPEWPNAGAVVAHLLGERDRFPPWLVFGDRDVDTGLAVSRGFGPGFLPVSACDVDYPYSSRSEVDTPSFGDWAFVVPFFLGSSARFLTLNMFPTVFDAPSWDCHAAGGSLNTTLADYRDTVAPMFDAAFTTLLANLESVGRLDRTLVVATGEFGRTPYLNAGGGRDHHPGCWTAIVAGGGVQGGRAIGASDRLGGEPVDRPVTPPELLATVYHALGISTATTIPGPAGTPVRIVDAEPVAELF